MMNSIFAQILNVAQSDALIKYDETPKDLKEKKNRVEEYL